MWRSGDLSRTIARSAAALSWLLLAATACTRILGIDGSYELVPDTLEPSGGRDAGGGSGGSIGRRPDASIETGGTHPFAGASGTGGVTPLGGTGGSGGVAQSAGGARSETTTGGAAPVLDAGAGGTSIVGEDGGLGICRPGRYSGTYTGGHFPAFSPVSLDASGNANMTLGPVVAGSAKFTGALTGRVRATFAGTLDCHSSTGAVTAVFDDATYLYPTVPPGSQPISGEIHLTVDKPGSMTGDFTESEPATTAHGSGTVSVERYGP